METHLTSSDFGKHQTARVYINWQLDKLTPKGLEIDRRRAAEVRVQKADPIREAMGERR